MRAKFPNSQFGTSILNVRRKAAFVTFASLLMGSVFIIAAPPLGSLAAHAQEKSKATGGAASQPKTAAPAKATTPNPLPAPAAVKAPADAAPPAAVVESVFSPEVAAIVNLDNVKARAAAAKDSGNYQAASWDPIHFKPAIDAASDQACLVCHSEINTTKVRDQSPAGVEAKDTLAWSQVLSTYAGSQESFHWRHLQSPYAKSVMNLSCNFCHQGNDLRERSPHVTAADEKGNIVTSWNDNGPPFSLRKLVNPTQTCLRCHGSYPGEIMGLPNNWLETKDSLETPETPNGCLTCHAEQFRTNRHQVTYLKPKGIEEAATKNSDVCFGCHGGRAWYRISYPYPRHAWEGMPTDKPDWAANRPTESDKRFQLPEAKK